MRITIEIPREFEQHFMRDRFEDSLRRVSVDMHNEMSCEVGISGTYEIELVDMLTEAFKNARYEVQLPSGRAFNQGHNSSFHNP